MAWDALHTDQSPRSTRDGNGNKTEAGGEAEGSYKSADEVSMTVNRDGQFWIRHGGADPMRILKDLPLMMAKWKPAHYQVTMTFELPMPAAKKAPAKKIAPMH